MDELAAPELSVNVPLLLITIKVWGDLDEPIADARVRPGYGFKRGWLDPVLRDRDVHLEKHGCKHSGSMGFNRALKEVCLARCVPFGGRDRYPPAT